MRTLLVVFFALFCACASSPPPPAAAPPPDSASLPDVASASATAAVDTPPAVQTRPLDLTSACSHDMHLYFGERPGDGHGQAGVVTAGATIPVPRGADGAVVVWVVDEAGAGLASVHVTKHMRHVRIDAACMKLDADSTR